MSEDRLFSRIAVHNFKSIKAASLSLRPLTVLVGENSAGKSSILQSVFLLAQVTQSRARPGIIGLNGMELNLGNFRDVLHSSSADGRVQIAVTLPAEGPGVRRAPIRRQLSLQDELDEEEAAANIAGDWATWTLTLEDAQDELGAAQVAGVLVSDDSNGQALEIRPTSDPGGVAELYASALRESGHIDRPRGDG